MLSCTKKGAAGDGARDNVFRFPAELVKITKDVGEFQRLDGVVDDLVAGLSTRRVTWLARRYGLAPTMARAVAFLAFEEGR